MTISRKAFVATGIVAMMLVVAVSNYLVQFPINDWLTWAAFTYPVAFLVTDSVNRTLGAKNARLVVIAGFAFAVAVSVWVATPRIAAASGSAFLAAQLLDVGIFDRLRDAPWWRAPLISSAIASVVDTGLFFGLAFAYTGLPWLTWAAGDLAAKALMAFVLLLPFRWLVNWSRPRVSSAV